MADLTYDTELPFNGLLRKTIPFVILNGVQLYTAMILRLSAGYATKQAAGAGTVVLGIAVAGGVPGSNPVLDGFNLQTLPIPQIGPGNASTAAAGNANQVIVETGEFTATQTPITLAGTTLAGTQADVGTVVYAPTSNIGDLTTTQTSTDKPFGRIAAFWSATATIGTYDVLVFSYEARLGM